MIWEIIGIAWTGLVIWATALTLLSKKLSWVKKIIICSAIILSFYLAAFIDDYEGVFPSLYSEYV